MNAGADIGEAKDFEETLDGAVFTRWTVQRWKNDIGCSTQECLGCPGIQFDEVRCVASLCKCSCNFCGRCTGNFGFRRWTAHQDCDVESSTGQLIVSRLSISIGARESAAVMPKIRQKKAYSASSARTMLAAARKPWPSSGNSR